MGKWTIPRSIDYTLREGDSGVVVWALQKQAVRLLGSKLWLDGDFGPATKEAVEDLQRFLAIPADGVAGPQTQTALAEYLCALPTDLPRRLLWSLSSYESSGYLGAVNWSSPGGVDCGITQRRVLESDYRNDAVIERAFDAVYQVSLSARTLRSRFSTWISRPGIAGNDERCWRTSVLFHNYPALAERLSIGWTAGLSPYYVTPQKWVEDRGLKFPDGHSVRTPLEWGERYSLGNPVHREPGQAVRFVTRWEA